MLVQYSIGYLSSQMHPCALDLTTTGMARMRLLVWRTFTRTFSDRQCDVR